MKLDIEKIDKYIDGRATSEEQEEVLTWLSTDEGQTEMSLRLDKEISTITVETAVDWLNHAIPSERMMKRFMNNIHPVRKCKVWPKVAAIVIPFFILSGCIYFLSSRLGIFAKPEYVSIEVPRGEQMRIVLQDGTEVHLNSSSCMRYPKKMGLFHRRVELSGEAYFHVAKEQGRPFIVDLNGVSVRVTGTQFNVKAYPGESSVQVLLCEGGVSLENNASREYSLEPGECAGYDRNTGHCDISRVKDTQVIIGWRSHCLNFYRTSFGEILRTLERQCDVTFQVSDKRLLDIHFTLSTSEMQVSDILEDLTAVSQINFIDKDNNGRIFIVSSKEK